MRRKQVNVCLPEAWPAAMAGLASEYGTSMRSVYLAAFELLLNCPSGQRALLIRFFAAHKRAHLDTLKPGACAAAISANAQALVDSLEFSAAPLLRAPRAKPGRRRRLVAQPERCP